MQLPPTSLTPHHIALKVRDVATVAAFYIQVLGLPVVKQWHHESGTLRAVWLTSGDLIMMIERSTYDWMTTDGPPPSFSDDPPGWHVVTFTIDPDQRENWCQYLTDAGIPIVHETQYTIYVQDPEGNRVGLSHYPEAA